MSDAASSELPSRPMARPRRTLEQRLELARLAEARAAERHLRKARKVQKYESVAKARDRKLDTRRKIIAGALALEHMRHDAAWATVFRNLLDQYVTKDAERLLFGLPSLPPDEGDGKAGTGAGGQGGAATTNAAPPQAVAVSQLSPAAAVPVTRRPDAAPSPKNGPTAPPTLPIPAALTQAAKRQSLASPVAAPASPVKSGGDLRTLAGPAAASVRVGGTPIGKGYLAPAPRPSAAFFKLLGKK